MLLIINYVHCQYIKKSVYTYIVKSFNVTVIIKIILFNYIYLRNAREEFNDVFYGLVTTY